MRYLAIVLLLLMSCFFAAVETSYSSLSSIRLKRLASKGSRGAVRALKIAGSFNKTLTAILVGNNIVTLTIAALGALIFIDLLGDAVGALVSTVVMTVLVLIFGEIIPKTYARLEPEKTAITLSIPLYVSILLLSPVVYIFMLIQKGVSKSHASDSPAPSVTEDELKYIIDEIEDQGVLEEKESDLVRSALEFDETSIEQILVPRVKIVAVEQGDDIDKILNVFLTERYSRLPVYDKSIDNIIGLLHEKDFMAMMVGGGEKSIAQIVKKAVYVSETKRIPEVLYEMQRTKTHMAIVKDQYGGTSGIVTMEDIIEELVGEIYDENDEIVHAVIDIGENEYEIQGALAVSDMLERLELPEDIIISESNTVSGWATEVFECIPEVGDSIESGIFTLTVLNANDRHVGCIKLGVNREGAL